MTFENIRPVRLATAPEHIADQIRQSITDGTLPAGTQLTETQLAERLEVSRGPVREAMQRLIQEGLLRAERHRGVFVAELGVADIADIYVARAAIERTAVLALMEREDYSQVLDRLDEIVEAMEVGVRAHDWRTVLDADLHFHEAIVAAAQSKRLARMFRTLSAETRMSITGLKRDLPDWQHMVAEHRVLLAAFRRGARDEVLDAVDEHLEGSMRRFKADEPQPEAV
jgi:DNA-binding GntR family transcriptional regulator